MNQNRQGARATHLIIAIAVVALDRLTKWLIAANISLHDSITIIPGFFRITHVENSGAAFGLFSDSAFQWKLVLLILFSLLALAVVGVLLWRNHYTMASTGAGLALILGGAIGNLWDRIFFGFVPDFLDFFVGTYHWPSFNIADSAIVIGAGLLVAEILFSKSESKDGVRSQGSA